MRRVLFTMSLVVAVGSVVISLGACGPGKPAYIPVDNQLRTWEPPEADAYTPDPPSTSAATPPAAAAPATADKPAAAKPAAPAAPAPKAAPAAKEKEKEKKAEKRP